MAHIQSIQGIAPRIGKNCWIAENATLVGDVILGEYCTVWFNTVLRGDVNSIQIGTRTNIQDGAVVHCTYKRSKVWIGNDVSIGHNAVIHGCRIEERVLIGMGAIVMDEAIIQSNALVAAGAVVLERCVVESGYIYAGVPAKKVKKIDTTLQEIFEKTAKNYVKYASWFQESDKISQ